MCAMLCHAAEKFQRAEPLVRSAVSYGIRIGRDRDAGYLQVTIKHPQILRIIISALNLVKIYLTKTYSYAYSISYP